MNYLKLAGGAVAGAALIYAGIVAGLYVAMRRPPADFAALMNHVPMQAMMVLPFERLWNRARGGTVAVGDLAPDFELPTFDRERKFRLSSLRGRPVVLVFGSYT